MVAPRKSANALNVAPLGLLLFRVRPVKPGGDFGGVWDESGVSDSQPAADRTGDSESELVVEFLIYLPRPVAVPAAFSLEQGIGADNDIRDFLFRVSGNHRLENDFGGHGPSFDFAQDYSPRLTYHYLFQSAWPDSSKSLKIKQIYSLPQHYPRSQ